MREVAGSYPKRKDAALAVITLHIDVLKASSRSLENAAVYESDVG